MMQDAHSRTRPARPLACIRTILEVQYAATYIRVWIICVAILVPRGSVALINQNHKKISSEVRTYDSATPSLRSDRIGGV